MKQLRFRQIAILVFSLILSFAVCSSAATKAKGKRSSKSRSSRGRSGRSSRGRGRASRRGRGGRAVAGRSGRGGRLVALRDSRGRVKRDRRGRIMYARVAPPKPRPGAEIPNGRVSEIQHALAQQGFYKGEASGTYDDSTKSAMSQYQAAHGLKATGLPTAQTLKLLGLTKSTASNTPTPTNDPATRPRTVTKKNP